MFFKKQKDLCHYCTCCGHKVDDYKPSNKSNKSSYFCSICNETLTAERNDISVTGHLCECGAFWAFSVEYCGYCGNKL